MQHAKSLVKRFAPGIVAILTLALTLNANSSGCFIVHQPKAPKALDDYKKIK